MAIPDPDQFEKLASFYLGRQYDLDDGKLLEQLLTYDAKDLCTHAMCVGMTGSGKTGLCVSLLEEAALDGVPAICVDPKGDLANLMLTFPALRGSDFLPWLEKGDATRKGMTLEQFAESTAKKWREGLASWGQSPERVAALKDAVDVAVYTPGSNIGLPLTVLRSFDAPPPATLDDVELIGERVTGAVSGLLTLMGMEADPLNSSEHILLSSILTHQWREGENVSIADLIRLIQSPPISRIGVVDLESFMPQSVRIKLAMKLNHLLASPAFASWLEGEGLSIDRLLRTPEGKPRISILSIAHLNDNERMFFVTILLNELVAWMRAQSGTGSLRSIFYMDEVAGYFPPVANPPSKPPMLTLLKQARAFGLGITLATQNPVDLDYKGLSNIGTWFLGRLQTERDKARVLEGLEGASVQSGKAFNRAAMERTLAGLGNRVFLMNNVHNDMPVTFQTRWAMSFLAGPLARTQISQLMEERKRLRESGDEVAEAVSSSIPSADRPPVPAGVPEKFLAPSRRAMTGTQCCYRPALLGRGSLHFIRSSADLDLWTDRAALLACSTGVPNELWESATRVSGELDLRREPEPEWGFAELPDALLSKGNYRSYKSKLKDHFYRHCSLPLFKCPGVRGYAPGGADLAAARAHFEQMLREKRDVETEKLRDRFEKRMASLEKKIRTAEDRIEREESQYGQAKLSSLLSVGSSLMGAFLGGRRGGIMTAARGLGRASQQKDDVRRAEKAMDLLKEDMKELEDELKQEIAELKARCDIEVVELETIDIPPRKSDLKVEDVVLLWTPWQVDSQGIATPLFETEAN